MGDVEYNVVVSSVADIVIIEFFIVFLFRKRGKYTYFFVEIRVKIGKYVSENGNLKVICYFKKELLVFKESIVRIFK